jgi:peptidoglycan lytic transglycosylase
MDRLDSRDSLYYLRFIITLAISCVFVLFLHGCTGYTTYKPHTELKGYKETGMASYYARNLQHRKTASGELLNNNSMTAAHKTLPFGTEVIVKSLDNGKSVKVRINDRGPFIKGRIIDLTRAAFSEISNLDKGVEKVEIRVVN